MKYIALGDSYSIGEGVPENERWPNQLAQALTQRAQPIGAPTIIATTGWRTDNLANAISIAKLKGEYDLVSLLIGVNNQYQGRPVEQFAIEFESLLNTSIRLAKGRIKGVFVVSIPDYGFTPFGLKNKDKISREIDQFNRATVHVCQKYDVKFINITDISREAINDPALVATDGLHPSGKMYSLWTKRIAEELIRK